MQQTGTLSSYLPNICRAQALSGLLTLMDLAQAWLRLIIHLLHYVPHPLPTHPVFADVMSYLVFLLWQCPSH